MPLLLRPHDRQGHHAEDEELRAAEDEQDLGDLPDWQVEQIQAAKEFLAAEGSGRFVSFPDKSEINEWNMMQEFAEGVEDAEQAEALQQAILGRGAFRYFKDRVHEFGLSDTWYKFRDGQYRQLARQWCEDHGIEADETV